MRTVTASCRAHPADLWAVLADLERWSQHVPTVTSVRRVGGPEPTATGSRFEIRQPRLPESVYEVTSWVPGESFVWESRSRALVSTATHVVSADGEGSRLTLTFGWSGPLSGLARLTGSRTGRRYLEAEAQAMCRRAEAP